MTSRRKVVEIPKPRLSSVPGTAYVRRAAYSRGAQVGAEAESTESIAVPMFAGPTATVEIGGSITRNMGNFNSCRVEARVMLPCYPEETEVRRVALIASQWVSELIDHELKAANVETEEPETPTGGPVRIVSLPSGR